MPRKIEGSRTKLLQIPVKATIAERIAEYGSRVSKSQAQFAIICLERAFENREEFLDRLGESLVSMIGSAIPSTRSFKKQVKDDTRIVRLQVPTPHSLIAKLEVVGAEMNHSPVQAAGWLLEKILTDEDWIVRAVLSPLVVDVTRWVQGISGAKSCASKSPEHST